MRAPVAATGCPRLHPLLLTFTMSSSMPRIREQATGTDAKASLISNNLTSSIVSPHRESANGIASVGASPVLAGSTPTDART